VNIPNRAFDRHRPFEVCRLGRRHAAEKVISQRSPHGETMYWIGGAGLPKDGPTAPTSMPRRRAACPSRRCRST
jgi:broad specificity polyphosphatase/5'/3'-nucleotidase SurE